MSSSSYTRGIVYAARVALSVHVSR
jgi:hypothetical protein